MAAQQGTPSSFSLANHFLIAMPAMEDPFFKESVIYLCEHSADGAMGIIVNKPSPIMMDLLFDSAKTPTPERFHGQNVLMGGPVQVDRGFLVHTPAGSWESSLMITDDIAITTSRDIIMGLTQENEVNKAVATIGYSSWSAGQLEQELANNSWISTPADMQILFDMPYKQRYKAALQLLNIDITNLSGLVGHA
ncbi:YqgE/AlgH family protein [Snodgrassella communis]|uniref:YqgE/AlgH family protein n=1 Tax=Snodgrassella communis TaxID=2946699 RepID=UPI001EF49071|nr:YqgE/AlgH family protein [Snodgrassella communis]